MPVLLIDVSFAVPGKLMDGDGHKEYKSPVPMVTICDMNSPLPSLVLGFSRLNGGWMGD